MDNDDQNLKEQLSTLPREVQAALTSPETARRIKEIGNKFDLKMDQVSVLFDLTADILFGTISSKDFVSLFMEQAEVDQKKAFAVAQKLNAEIFDRLRLSLREAQDNGGDDVGLDLNNEHNVRAEVVSSISSAGGFEIEHEPLEKPLAPSWKAATPVNKIMSEPLVDQLLNGSVSTPEEKIEIIAPQTTPTKVSPAPNVQPPANLPTNDPYREPTK
jgi:hypothetical protein